MNSPRLKRSDSIDSITEPQKTHLYSEGIQMYFHNVQFLGGGPSQKKERSSEIIEKLGERARACDITLIVEVMDGTKKDPTMTPEQLFEQAVWSIEFAGNSVISRNTITRDKRAFIASLENEVYECDGIKNNLALSAHLKQELNSALQDLLVFTNEADKRENRSKIKILMQDYGSKWKEFIETLEAFRPKTSNTQSLRDKEEGADLAAVPAVNPGDAELERIKKAAGDAYLKEYRTCGKGTGEGVGLIYDSTKLTCIRSETIPLMSGHGIRGTAFFHMRIKETGYEFGVVGAHLPFGNIQAREQCLRNFMPIMEAQGLEKKLDLIVAGDFNITEELEDAAKDFEGSKRGKATSESEKEEYDRVFSIPYSLEDEGSGKLIDEATYRVTRTVGEQAITDHLGLRFVYEPPVKQGLMLDGSSDAEKDVNPMFDSREATMDGNAQPKFAFDSSDIEALVSKDKNLQAAPARVNPRLSKNNPYGPAVKDNANKDRRFNPY